MCSISNLVLFAAGYGRREVYECNGGCDDDWQVGSRGTCACKWLIYGKDSCNRDFIEVNVSRRPGWEMPFANRNCARNR